MQHIVPTEAQGAALARRLDGHDGPVVMLNLLKFRETAAYAQPAPPVSGRVAYDRYEAAIRPLLAASGGEVLLDGTGGAWFIGPEAERWDRVLLVRQASLAAFFAFATDPAAQAAGLHREAALEDSRLLPLTARL